MARAAATVAAVEFDPDWVGTRFATDHAESALAAAFDDVVVHDAGGTFPVPDPEVVVGYLASWPPEALGLRSGPVWDAVLAEMSRLVHAHFDTHGVFKITSTAAVLLAR
jgi:hypothetical protein